MQFSKYRRASAAVILLGLAIRLPAVFMPIEEGHRNAQTAVLTAGMVENGGLRLDPIAPWRGDLEARLAQELPVYNLAVLAIDRLPGVSFDAAGRTVSLIFWIVSCLALQALWKRTLPPGACVWANLLFVLAPMNWYLSTAFMPETLVQLLSICFLVAAIDYALQPKTRTLLAITSLATLGLLIKLPAFAHLGLFAGCVLADRQGWPAVFRPQILLCAAFTVAAVALWGRYISGINAEFFPYWTGQENILGFIQPQTSRLGFSFLASLAGYNLAFVLPVIAAPFAVVGAASALGRVRRHFEDRIWLYLLGSLAIYWFLWAKGAAAQSYYNLPNLVLLSALFGIGTDNALRWMHNSQMLRLAVEAAKVCLTVLLLISGVVGFSHLSRPDRVTVEASEWIKKNTRPDDLILFQPRHSPSVMDYEHQPLLAYLTGRRTWIWTRSTPEWEKMRALQSSAYAVVTSPAPSEGCLEKMRRKFKGEPPSPPTSIKELYPERLDLAGSGPGYDIYLVRSSGVVP